MRTGTQSRTVAAVAVAAIALLVAVFAVSGHVARVPGAAQPTGPVTSTSTSATTSATIPSQSSTSATTPGATTTTSKPTGTSTGTSTAVPPFPTSLRGKDITVVPTTRKVVALTFDAGANSAGLNSILTTLANQRVPATFFLTGNWASANPAAVTAIRSAGHRIGNHSMSHPTFSALTDARLNQEVLDAEHAIRAAGADPRPLFRFPYGDRDARTIAAVNSLGYLSVRWTVDTLGWKGTSGGMTAAQVADRAVGALQPGEIVLMHIGSNPDDQSTLDADALAGMIGRMRNAGYGFVTLDLLLAR